MMKLVSVYPREMVFSFHFEIFAICMYVDIVHVLCVCVRACVCMHACMHTCLCGINWCYLYTYRQLMPLMEPRDSKVVNSLNVLQ